MSSQPGFDKVSEKQDNVQATDGFFASLSVASLGIQCTYQYGEGPQAEGLTDVGLCDLLSRLKIMRVDELDYHLPEALIAQYPVEPRDRARLFVLKRAKGEMIHTIFSRVMDFLCEGDVLVVNDSKVIPARLLGHKETRGRVEVLLLRKLALDGEVWECLVKKGKRLKKGSRVDFSPELKGEVVGNGSGGKKDIAFEVQGQFWEVIHKIGHIPLPPYIKRAAQAEIDSEAYQTIFAREEGALAAPTAGLHFRPELVKNIEEKGVQVIPLTLHVGLGSFQPIRTDEVGDHHLEPEWQWIPVRTAEIINAARKKGGRIFAVGTTVVRALESAADATGEVHPRNGMTDLYIYPGYRFKAVDGLITNFHLPRSTLLLLVFAFAGKDLIRRAYQEAIRQEYRFYSYGDGMLIM